LFLACIVLVLVLGRTKRPFEDEDEDEDENGDEHEDDWRGSGWVLVDLAPLQTECGALIRS